MHVLLLRFGVVLQAKQDAKNLRAQLKDEKAKLKQAQQALVNEQQYFMNKLADMEAITKGALLRACGMVPGSSCFRHVILKYTACAWPDHVSTYKAPQHPCTHPACNEPVSKEPHASQ